MRDKLVGIENRFEEIDQNLTAEDIIAEYDIDINTALKDVIIFTEKMNEAGIIE